MRSIFAKILLSVLGVALFTVLCISFILSSLFVNLFYDRYERSLRDALGQATLITTKYQQGQLSDTQYDRALAVIERLEQTHFIVLDGEREVVFKTQSGTGGSPTQAIMSLLLLEATSKGTQITRFDDPMDSALDILAGAAAVPRGTIVGYVHVADVREALTEVLRLVWLAALGAFALAIVPTYLMSRHFTEPLIKMNQAAQDMGRGDFTVRVNSDRQDEIGQLASTLDDMARQLGRFERTRQDLLANVSHELRSPLTSIRGFVQGVLDGTIPEREQASYLSKVFVETGRLSRIVEDVLTLARLQGGRMELKYEPTDPGRLLADAVEMLEPQSTEKNVDVAISVPSDGRTVFADRNRLTQVFMNVLANAIKFSPDGGRVEVSGSWDEGGFTAKVSDEGPGIPEGELPYIFERFYVGNNADGREYPGTGLGLAISRLLVESHGGTITAANRNGVGSEFVIVLPA